VTDVYRQREPRRVLIVDDDDAAAQPLTAVLNTAGYQVRWVRDIRTARAVSDEFLPHVIVLEMMLAESLRILMSVSLTQPKPRIVVCSGTRRRQDKTLALRLGADDFIAKPVDLDNISARVARMMPVPPPEEIPPPTYTKSGGVRVGNLFLGSPRHVRVGSLGLRLSPTQYGILRALASQPGEFISREELAREAAPRPGAGSFKGIPVQIYRLRKYLLSAGLSYPCLESVRGKGYRLALGPSLDR